MTAAPPQRRRGRCPVCRYRWPLRKDGTLGRHHLYSGSEKKPACAGEGSTPIEQEIREDAVTVAADETP